jgi:hypothetical protein
MTAVEHDQVLMRRLAEIVNARDFDALAKIASGQVAEEAARWVGPFAASCS